MAQRFPHLEGKIRVLARKDETFREICNDYADVVKAIDGIKEDELQGDDKTHEDLSKLRDDLADEILEILNLV